MCDTSKKIVIVGAGIAGVSAVQLLHAEGFKNVTVLEAKSYIGGRICTQPYGKRCVIMCCVLCDFTTVLQLYQIVTILVFYICHNPLLS